MKITNPSNASVVIESGGRRVAIDPWGNSHPYRTWHHWPPVSDIERHYEGADYVLVTHQHEDHADVPLLRRLAFGGAWVFCPPTLQPWLMRQLGEGARAMVVAFGPMNAPQAMAGPFDVSLVPPMNSHGQDSRRSENYEIDYGFIVRCEGKKLVFLADNTPYRPEDAGPVLERMKGCDLLALSYNGLASDFPLNYGLSDAETYAIVKKREQRRLDANLAFVRMIQPKELLLYSSDFWPAGPMAERFELATRGWWGNRESASSVYARACPGVKVWEPAPRVDPWLTAKHLRGEAWLYEGLPDVTQQELYELAGDAADEMVCEARERGVECNWILRIPAAQREVDLGDLTHGPLNGYTPRGRGVLTLHGDPRYLAAILRGEIHWNAARLSFLLQWRREPQTYEPRLYDALNYFRLPAKREAEAA